jgi:hypothetical protein
MAQRPDEVTGVDAIAKTAADATDVGAEAIREDIERTRGEMSGTIDAIQERLSPVHIKEQVMEQVREQVQEAKHAVREATIGKVENFMSAAGDSVRTARRGVVETIRDNPVPAAIAGVGLGWLLVSGLSGGSRSRMGRSARAYRGRVDARRQTYSSGAIPYANQRREPGMLEEGQRVVGDTVDTARAYANDIADDVRETAGEWATAAQDRAERVGGWLQETAVDNPLAVGAVALAAGAVMGFAIPISRKENELMGETRDSVVEGAQGLASEAMREVRRAADRAADRVEEATRPEVPPSR